MKNPFRFSALISLLILATVSYAEPDIQQRPARIVKDTNLLAEPQRKAASITKLEQETLVLVGERKRGWYLVTTQNKQQGWARLLDISFSLKEDQRSSMKSLFAGVSDLANAAQGQSTSAISTGVRGLDKTSILKAPVDNKGLSTMESYASDRQTAKAHAQALGLAQRSIDFPQKLTTSGDDGDAPSSSEEDPDYPFGE